MKREDALNILHEFIKKDALRAHMLAVEAVMVDYAAFYGEDPHDWALAGLLHDFDWEIHPTLEQHPQAGAPMLRAREVPEIIIRCILSHADHTGVPRESQMEKVLFASDELVGLVTAVTLVRPSRSIHDVKIKSVKKKMKDRRFAAAVSREDIAQGVEELGVDLGEHIGRVIASMQRIAGDLGLAGE
jgi:putative nucleotidyltransferase with HDIG domain